MSFLNDDAAAMATYLSPDAERGFHEEGMADSDAGWALVKDRFVTLAFGVLDDDGTPCDADAYRRVRVVLAIFNAFRAGDLSVDEFLLDMQSTIQVNIPVTAIQYIRALVQATHDHTKALATVSITTRTIKSACFSGCRTLTSVDMETSDMGLLPDHAFYRCASLIEIKLPRLLATIQARAFGHCTALAYIKLPSSIRHIGDGCFFNCTSLEPPTLPQRLLVITRLTFAGCTQFKRVDLKYITCVGQRAFANCVHLRLCKLPKVEQLRDNAFTGCALKYATLPANVRITGTPFDKGVRITTRK